MHHDGSRIVYTPSDLSTFLRSPYASWMDRFALEHPGEAEADPRTEDVELLLRKGRLHEQRVLEGFRAEGLDVVEIERGAGAPERTRQAIAERRQVIAQAALAAGPFSGYADFLLRDGQDGYRPLEAKLARTPRPDHVVQLCCYAALLARSADGRRTEDAVVRMALALGSGETTWLATADFIHYYRVVERAFLEFMEDWDPARPPLPEAQADHRPWRRRAEAVLKDLDHVSLVAGLGAEQARKLNRVRIATVAALAGAEPPPRVAGIQPATLARLQAQARLQRQATADRPPPFELLPTDPDNPRRGLALLPPASPLDVYFDMEGFPLDREPLEYLFGATHVEDGERRFSDWWAHDRDGERRAFEAFVDWVVDRFRRDPGMHVYHYAAYETNALKRLMGRFGTREDELDLLFGAEVFCDLYSVVRQGLVLGTPSYSIKHVERLYRDRREGDVGTAVDSIVHYQRFLDAGESPDWQRSPILRQIRDYNRDDCDSTLELAGWLRSRAREAGIAWAGRAREARPRPTDEQQAPAIARRSLIDRLRDSGAPAGRLLGELLDFHRREDRPMWWAMFDRHEMNDADLVEDVNCLGGLLLSGAEPSPAPGVERFRYRFDPEQDTKIREGKRCFFAHDLNVTLRVAALDLEAGKVTIELGRRALERIDGPPRRLGLIPSEWVPTDPLRRSIEEAARRYADGTVQPALDDYLERRRPRFDAGSTAPGASLVGDGEPPVEALLRLVPAMDETALLIQGPPGSGKTTAGARLIVDLLARGKTVGITSNSHTAVVNLMRKCAELRDGSLDCVKVGGERDPALFDACEGAIYCKRTTDAEGHLRRVSLIGGTAWLYCRPEFAGRLDYLFVDEAGQVSVANLVGMARAARNLVLIGDQMQLPQPTQAAHPGDSGASALDYYLDEATVPPDRGVFLDTTYRLHPDLCALISEAFYDGRLRPAPDNGRRVVKLPSDPAAAGRVTRESGVLYVPVRHDDNTQASPEEVEVVCELVASLCGRQRTDLAGSVVGSVEPRNILVVAPYNLQVRKLEQALPEGVRAGTVDRFQGQEAPIVIVTLCASDGRRSPRGLEFLLNPNRLNVALSRAQSLAIVVGHPDLVRTPCTSLAQLERVDLLCRIYESGGAGRPNPDRTGKSASLAQFFKYNKDRAERPPRAGEA